MTLARPVLAGVLLALSFPPFPLPLLVFLGLVPLLLFITEQEPGPAGRWNATRGGITFGVVYFGIQLYWVAVALLRYSILAAPAYLGLIALLAALAGAFAWAVHFTRERTELPLALLVAIYWTMLEWVQGHLGDLAFPWLGLGAALTPTPTLAGAADLAGALGLTVWIAAVNGLVATIILVVRGRRLELRSAAPALSALFVTFSLPILYGATRTATLDMRPAARVALVQPDIAEDTKLGPLGLDSALAALTRVTLRLESRPLEGRPLDLVVWPELALPADFLAHDRLRDTVHTLSRRVGAPILVGAYAVDGVDDPVAYNSAFLVDGREPLDGGIERYDKQRLVPFIERVPFVDPRVVAAGGDDRRFGDLGRGLEASVLGTPTDAPFGVLICFESVFAPLSRAYRVDDAEYLVNITNDAWYGARSPVGRTTALWQHPAHMVLRAIETRMGVARVANAGISMFIDPVGRAYGRTAVAEPAVAEDVVYTTGGRTLFVRWGDWLGPLVVVAGLGMLARAAASRSGAMRPPA